MNKLLPLKSLTRFRFSMVELVLCLAVVVVSIVGVLGLFPVGLETNKQTMGASFATDAGEQFLRFNASKVKADWTWTNVFANAKPGSDESHLSWNNTALFNAGNVTIKATNDLNPAVDSNSGFFCLQQLTGDKVDFAAVLRVWKDLEVNADDNSEKATLYVEVSWPASVPYDSSDRKKLQFSLDVFNAPEVAVAAATYGACSLTREHGAGFATTLAAAVNEDGTYAIQLIAVYDGCTDADCLQLTEYVVESDSTYTIDYIGGYGTTSADFGDASAGSDAFDGFKLSFVEGIGGDGNLEWFKLDYTVASLQDQRISAKTAAGDNIVSFTLEDFEFILDCVGTDNEAEGDVGSGSAADDGYSVAANTTLAVDMAMGVLSNSQKGKGVLANDESPNGELSAILISNVKHGSLTLNANGSFVYYPDEDYVGTDKFVYKAFDGIKMTNVAKAVINVIEVDPCADNSGPIFADFSLADATIDQSYSATIDPTNLPTDADGDTVTISASGLPSWLSFDANSNTFSGTPTEEGTVSFTLTATDTCANSTSAQVSLTAVCEAGNYNAPVWPNPSFTRSNRTQNQYFCYGLGSSNIPTDADGDSLTYEICDGPSWLYWDENISQIAGIPPQAGTFTWTICVSDGCHESSAQVTITIDSDGSSPCDGNSAPSFTDLTVANATVNAAYSASIDPTNMPTDSDGDTVSLSASGLPSWLSFDAASSSFSGTPTQAGTANFTLTATDSCGNSTSAQVTITIIDNSGYTVTGANLNINPANSDGNIFELTTSDGTLIDMDDMSDYYFAFGKTNMSYSGGASEVKVKVKAEGRTITIDGVDVELNTNTRYTLTGDMIVNLVNAHDNPNSWGQAKGHWWISIAGTGIEITPTP